MEFNHQKTPATETVEQSVEAPLLSTLKLD